MARVGAVPYYVLDLLDWDASWTPDVSTFGSLAGTNKWYGGVLAPNGKIYGIPFDASTILEIDPETQTTSTFGSLAGSAKWVGGVLAPNGKIYGIPFGASTILEIGTESPQTLEKVLAPELNKY